MATPWCVKINYLPAGITSEQLKKKFNIPEDRISIPRNQEGPHYYGRVNGFMTEDDANKFVQRWNKARIFSATIKCKAVPTQSRFDRDRKPDIGPDRNCEDGIECANARCEYNHPSEWDACEDGVDCESFYCDANHPFGRTNPCPDGRQCAASPCNYLHPSSEIEKCSSGAKCRIWQCQAWHPKKREKNCLDGELCHNSNCRRLHPPEWQACPHGIECNDYSCEQNHPPSRHTRCDESITCGNYYCTRLHPIEWDPCEAGIKCRDLDCPHTSHPTDRGLSMNQEDSSQETSLPRLLKSVEQRNIERQQAQLPILASKDEFCRRLEKERVLVVTAETGSGKTTQLPQYAAEYFGGLVVCTQPRVIAATSLASRVANEYDGMSVGRSVGYRVGIASVISGTNRVPGTDIIFMTDGALVQESAEDKQLSHVRVLIIDEAHERSLNTDIVMGIAKLLLKTRPTDFYVVISSATINPSKFLAFFERSDVEPLNVPGRVYDVHLEYLPKVEDSTEQHAVSTLKKLYNQHEGTTLVFLPGQREIEIAMDLFKRDLPDNCVSLPLYAALSLEEQDQVLQFDEGPNGERRMVVFCTNIAETSLTIKNTRVVIDSGLAKEAYVDKQLRSTAIQTIAISKASADQRKGRAGRTAPGHCVRLYAEDELTRDDIEPAILRSSLDLVVLQLVYLQLNPLKFPFIDPPDPDTLQTSLELLKDLDCVDADDVITLRGELFVKLNIDPRFSAFLVDTYIEHGPILESAAAIAAILAAPGSLFLIATTDDEKTMIRNRVADGAQKYDSDLIYFVSIFNQWRSVGMTIDSATRKCSVCHMVWNKGNICRACRVAYSTTHLCNNKILNTIESVYNSLIEVIKKPCWQLNPCSAQEANESDIIGTNLYKYFPENYGCLLTPSRPTAGVRMIRNKFEAQITDTSAFIRPSIGHRYFIAMSIINRPGRRYLVERLHPCRPPEDLGQNHSKK